MSSNVPKIRLIDMYEIISNGENLTEKALRNSENDKFLGCKFKISGNVHYGWVRISSELVGNSNFKLTIQDFAYESTPNQAISAGELSSSRSSAGSP